MNGKSTVFSASAPFALSLSKGERQIDQEIVMHPCARATLTGAGVALYAGRVFVGKKKGGTHGRIRVFFWFDAALLS
jgi:hypothetical protein